MAGFLDDFAPCRNDKCKIEEVHPAHPEDEAARRQVITACPECDAPLIPLSGGNKRTRKRKKPQGKRGMCSRCRWRGPITVDRPLEEEPVMKKIRKQWSRNA